MCLPVVTVRLGETAGDSTNKLMNYALQKCGDNITFETYSFKSSIHFIINFWFWLGFYCLNKSDGFDS